MNRLISVLAVVWTLLLVGIAVELYRIDVSLSWLSAPVKGIDAAIHEAIAHPPKPETEAQRAARLKADGERASTDMSYIMGFPPKRKGSSPSARRAPTPAAPHAQDPTAQSPVVSR